MYRAFGFAQPTEVGANLLLEPGSNEQSCWWTTLDKLAESGFNLGAGQWKPHVAEKISNEDPRELVADVLDDYRDIVTGLEKLFVELA